MTQHERIIKRLRDYGTVTNLELVSQYGILHPTRRITELRKKGYQITTDMDTRTNKFGEKIRIAVYKLEE